MRHKIRSSNSNLTLYTFLGLLFAFAATVDVGTVATKGMEHQQTYIQDATKSLGQ